MNIPPKYEDVVAKLDAAEVIIQAGEYVESHLEKQIDILRIDLDAALGREDAFREELASANSDKEAFGQNAIDLRKKIQELNGVISDRIAGRNALQQRLTGAEQRVGELEAALINVRETLGREYWDQYAGLDETRDILDAALKPVEEGEGA